MELTKLRFLNENNESYPDWEEKRLGEVGKFYRGKDLPKNDMFDGGKYACVHYGELFSSPIVLNPVNRTDYDGSKFNKGAIVMPSSDVTPDGLAKASVLQKDNVVVGGDTNIFISDESTDPIFLSHIIRFHKKKIMREVVGTTVKHVYAKDLKYIQYALPSLPEQEKIASFLSALDERIEAYSALLGLSREEKKAYSQRLFSRSLRFTQDDGSPYPDWEEKRLGEVGKFYRGKDLPKNVMFDRGKYACVHYGELFSSPVVFDPVNRTDYDGVKFNRGTIVMPSSDVTPDGLAKASVLQKDNVVVGGDTNIFISDGSTDSIFLSYLIRFYEKKIIREVVGTTVKHVYAKDLKNIQYPLPSLPEQEKIASFLSALDDRIENLTLKVEALKQEKKAYSQRMLG